MKSHSSTMEMLESTVCGDRRLFGASLFSGAGIGDLGFRASGIEIVATCELEPDRAALAAINFPNAEHFVRDIWEIHQDVAAYLSRRKQDLGSELFLMSCTAPCQGMSKSGQGTLLRNVRLGKRPELDPRNRLILPALAVIAEARPQWVVFENVVEMRNTVIEDEKGIIRPILDIIRDRLGADYVGEAYDVEFADYGIPQRRQRLITVYTRNEIAKERFARGAGLVPTPSHSRRPGRGRSKWVSVAEALAHFPPLDAAADDQAVDASIPFHRVPVLDPKKYEWVRHTPKGASAFDNQCVNPECRYDGNRTHGSTHDEAGVNRAHKDTPLYCERCGHLLPRPFTQLPDGNLRIMSGYTSAYKRMSADLPAPTLTRNLSYPCSDHKIHPTQNRVLSLAEAMLLQTISEYDYRWGPIEVSRGKGWSRLQVANDGLIRLVIGESIPPRFLHLLGRHIQRLSFCNDLTASDFEGQRSQLALL